jgi:drug/metabolite transporter (DMT)-like permease
MLISSEIAAVGLSLAAAASWGAADFAGGIASKRANVFGVVALTYGTGLVVLASLALATREPFPSWQVMGWGALAGLTGAVGLATLYRALAVGKMGITAPVCAVIGAALPIGVGVLSQGFPQALQISGFLLALVALWFLAKPEGSQGSPKGLGLAIIAGVATGLFLVIIKQVGNAALFWPIAASRVSSTVAMLIFVTVTRRRWVPGRGVVPLIMLAGTLDAFGNVFFLAAAQRGRLDIAAVLSSLYPAFTIGLAALLLKERMTRLQRAGMVAAIVAIPLIAR